jgi:hypothetical protein
VGAFPQQICWRPLAYPPPESGSHRLHAKVSRTERRSRMTRADRAMTSMQLRCSPVGPLLAQCLSTFDVMFAAKLVSSCGWLAS